MLKKIIILVLLSTTTILAKFIPERHIAEGQLLYAESIELGKFISAIKSFHRGLRGKIAGAELGLIAAKIKKNLGANLLENAGLQKFGFDIKAKLAMTVDTSGEQETYALYLPASKSKVLYNNIKKTLESSKNQPGFVKVEAVEIEPGVFKYKKFKEIFVLRGKDVVIITSQNQNYKKLLTRASNRIGNSNYYRSAKRNLLSLRPDAISFFLLRPDQIDLIFKNAGKQTLPFNEIKKFLVTIGGSFSANKRGIHCSLRYIFKPGYLDNPEFTLNKIFAGNFQGTSIDKFSRNPILYSFIRFNVANYLKLTKKFEPWFAKSLERKSRAAQKNTGLHLEKDFLRKLKGSFSLLLADLPPDRSLTDPKAWKLYFAFDYEPEMVKNINTLLKFYSEKEKNNPKLDLKSSKYRGHTLWKVTFKYSLGLGPAKHPPKETGKVFIYLKSNQAIITTNRNNLAKIMLTKASSLPSRLFQHTGDQAGSIWYLNIENIVKYLRQSSFRPFVMAYLGYVERIRNVVAKHRKTKNTLSFEATINLK